MKINWEHIVGWIAAAVMVAAVASCEARETEAKYKALEHCNGTCVY